VQLLDIRQKKKAWKPMGMGLKHAMHAIPERLLFPSILRRLSMVKPSNHCWITRIEAFETRD